ncbi:hypothetical protein CTAYLR_007512 [Chrysophaeum taylorii]|uniref:GrpE protein homolog n=1 Tax=Chrysophaeum taylorii TaxID=2483200 RepID=A0AAD7UK57_9STRA|nr:hypothetical protein CTAYLR_007512 [Chrysophaeum taylorii]
MLALRVLPRVGVVVAPTRARVVRCRPTFHSITARRNLSSTNNEGPAAESESEQPVKEEAAAKEKATEEEAAAAAAAAELAAALSERDEYKDKWMRTMAEMENMRKIKERDVANAREYSVQKFAKSMLEVSDSLGYALTASEKDDASLASLVEGVGLTRTQLVKAFNEHGLSEFGEVGDKFDPSMHEALFEFDDPDKDPSTVGQVLKTGFALHGRVIRAAQVGVIKARPSSAD